MFFDKRSKSASGISSIHLCAAGLLCLAFGLFLHCYAAKSADREFACYVYTIFRNIGFIGDLAATLGIVTLTAILFFTVIKLLCGK